MQSPGRGPTASRWLIALLLLLLLLPLPAAAWYKHVASPRYHTVGRAAGLLMGLRRSPYVWRRALRPAAGSLAWDGFGLGVSPQGPSARSTVSGGPAARDAVLLPSGVQKLWEVRRRSSRAGLPVSAPRSPRAPKSAPQPELRLGSYSLTSEEQARYAGRGRGTGTAADEGVSGDLRPERTSACPQGTLQPFHPRLPVEEGFPGAVPTLPAWGVGVAVVEVAQPSSHSPLCSFQSLRSVSCSVMVCAGNRRRQPPPLPRAVLIAAPARAPTPDAGGVSSDSRPVVWSIKPA